jgi:acetyltransferase-like isoleucine patch superfamily enzyme
MFRAIVERSIATLKRDPSYRLDARLSTRQIIGVTTSRSMQLVRGLGLRITARSVSGPVFRGRRVVVDHSSQLTAGPALILEDGVYLNALSSEGMRLGRNVTIARNAILRCTGVIADLGNGIVLGDRCAVGAGSVLQGQGGITVGHDVIMGPGVRILAENHRFDDASRTIREQGVSREGIVVGSDCWIGANAIIVDGVTIGDGCVIGAGAVVTHDLPPFSVAAGVPARVIRSRAPSSAAPVQQEGPPTTTDSPAKIPSLPEMAEAAPRTQQ